MQTISKIIFFLLLTVITISCFNRTNSTDLDFKVFHQAAVRVINHQTDFYDFKRDKIFTYKYSPIFPLMIAPLGKLPHISAKKVWAYLNLLALPLSIFFIYKIFTIVTGEVPSFNNLSLTLIMTAQAFTNNATQGNINTLLLFLIAASLYLSMIKKEFFSGMLAAIGFSIKLTPGVVFIYFFFYKKWKELFYSAGISLLLLVIIPISFFGFETTVDLYRGWKIVLSDTTHFPFYKYTNQSPLVVMTHILNLAEANVLAKFFHYGFNLLMLSGFVYFYLRKNLGAFLSMTFAFLLTAAPVVWMEYHLVLFFPLLLTNQWLLSKTLSSVSKILWWLKFIIGMLLVKAIIGNDYSDIFTYYGRSFITLIILLFIIIIEDRTSSKRYLVPFRD